MLAKFIENRNYWVVRADGGKHFQNFTKNSFIGVGYVDKMSNEISEINQIFLDKIHKHFSINNISKSKAHQLDRFIRKIDVNDIVITIDAQKIAIGRVKSLPYINKFDSELNNKIIIRRDIEWGPSLFRNRLPYELQNSLKANLTVFNINKYAVDLYHSIFPFFLRRDDLHTSININTKNHIKAEDIANLFSTITSIEKSLEKLFFEKFNLCLNVESIVKAEFSSPGTVRAVFRLVEKKFPKWLIYAVIINSIVFGNSVVGFNGIIDLGTKHILLKYLLEHSNRDETQKSLEELKISLPANDLGFFKDEMIDLEALSDYQLEPSKLKNYSSSN